MSRLLGLIFLSVFSFFGVLNTNAVASTTKTVVIEKKVDINHATAEEFSTLKGIGPKKAMMIVSYRKDHGAFKNLNDLTHVKGIGTKTLAKLEKNNPGRLVVNNTEKLG